MVRCLLLVHLVFFTTFAMAVGESPQSLTLDGRLYNSTSGTDPLIDPSITLTIDVLNPNKDCILYQERQTISTSGSNGAFSIQVGTPTAGGASSNRTGSDSLNAMATVFQNAAAISGKLVSTNASCTYTPANGDLRYIRVHVSPSTGAASVLTPDLTVDSVPTALVAESLNGVVSSSILQADATTSLNQTNLASVFSNSNYPKLTSLLSGGSSQYVSSGSGTGASLPSYSTASPPSTPAAGSIWYDSTAQVVKLYDGSTVQTLGVSGGSTPTGGAGGDLGGSYPNPSVATVGTSTASNIHAAELLANSATNLNTSSMIVKRDGSGNFAATQASLSSMVLRDTGSNTLTLQSPAAYTSSYAITLPAAAPTVSGQVLAATTGGVASWYTLPAALPPNGSASGDLSGSYPGPTVAKIQGNAVSATTPTATGQVYKYTTGSPGSFAPGFIGVADIRSTVAGNAQFFPTTCTASQTFVWDSPTDKMNCTDITVTAANFANQTANTVFAGPASGGAAAAAFRSLASADLPKTGADGAYVNGGNSFGQAAILGTNDSNTLSFETNNTARMTLDTSGYVGIGTTSPNAKLNILTGSIGTTQSNAYGLSLINLTPAAAGAQQMSPAIHWQGQGWETFDPSSANVNFRAFVMPTQGTAVPGGFLTFQSQIVGAYTDNMVITSAGLVGIGTTSPRASLDLSSKTDAIGLPSGNTAAQPSSPVAGMIRYNSQTTNVEFYNGSAWTALSAAGGSYLSSSGGTVSGAVTISSGGASITGGVDNNSGGITEAGSITGVGANLTGAGAMTVAAGGTAQNLTLNSSTSGSVNVGSGNGTSLSVLDGGASTVNYITARGAAAGSSPVIGTAGSDTNIDLTFTPKGSGNSIFSTGSVGIGTTSPAEKLHVQNGNIKATSSASAPTLVLAKTGTNASSIHVSPTSVTYSPVIDSGDTGGTALQGIKMTPYSGSAVAIGGIDGFSFIPYTEGAGTTADVKGFYAAPYFDGPVTTFTGVKVEMYTTSTLTNAIGVHVADMDRSGTGLANRYGIKLDAPSNAVTGEDFGIHQAGSGQKNYFAGSVGIGTTSPESTLDVNGMAIFRDDFEVATADNGGAITLTRSDSSVVSGDILGQILVGDDDGAVSPASAIEIRASQDHSGTAKGTKISIFTTPNSSTTAQERVTILESGKVGIGTTSPTKNLHVYGTTSVVARVESSGADGNAAQITLAGGGTNANWAIATNESASGGAVDSLYISKNAGTTGTKMVIQDNGRVGIGTTSPGQMLEVNGNVLATAFISTSDRRLKTNIRPIEGLALISRLNGVRYQWKKDGVEDFGLIAQEVEDVMPEAVVTNADTGYKAVKYSNLVSPLIESTKELYGMCKMMDDQIQQLAAENVQLKKQLVDIQQQNAQMEERLRAIEARLGLK